MTIVASTSPVEWPAGSRDSIVPASPRPATLDPIFSEAVRHLTTLLDERLTRLDYQISAVLAFLSNPAVSLAVPSSVREMPPVTVSCLGSFQFVVEGREIGGWRSSKARSLFQYLIAHRGRPIPRDTLIQALWPDPDAIAAGTSLKVAVHALRQVLSQANHGAAYLTILAHDCGYQLSAPQLWVDVEEFEHCYALGRAFESQGRVAQARALYTRAVDLYRGDFLEELIDDWPMFRREALKDQYLFVLSCLAKAAVESGDYQSGVVRCQQLLARDRCREDAYRLLMICHARLGQRSRVRRWYELCVQTLRTELDCDPEPETEQVFRQACEGKA